MKRVTMVLNLRVTFEQEDDHLTVAEVSQLKRNLDAIPGYMAGNGVFTDDCGSVTVESWAHSVTVLKRSD